MGRGPKNQDNRRKGPAGTGRARKREKQIRERSKKDQQEVLAALHQKRKRRIDHENSQGKNAAVSSNQSTGFDKALSAQGPMPAAPFKKNFWRGPDPPPGEPDEALKMQRKAIGIKVKGAPSPPPVSTFTDSALPKHFSDFKAFCSARGGTVGRVEKPTPIQSQVWPSVLCGLDVIGIAPTGSGKTLAYLLPAVPHILGQEEDKQQSKGPRCLVLMPTRELAKQVCDVCGGGGSGSGAGTSGGGWLKRLFSLRAGAVYGGLGKEEQLDSILTLGVPHILCATPGRLLDLMGLAVLSLDRVTYLVLDEADRMLALGFEAQLNAIIKSVRSNRQALLFSATFPGKLREAAEQWMASDRVIIRVGTVELTAGSSAQLDAADDDGASMKAPHDPEARAADAAEGTKELRSSEGKAVAEDAKDSSTPSTLTVSPTIHQTVHVCAQTRVKKERKLLKFIAQVRAKEKSFGVRQRAAILIFCKEIKTLRTVAKLVEKNGERCAPLHSGIPQAKREEALASMKSGKVDTLVATDVASRGIHITRLRHVVNYDFPGNLEAYCHRIGRVGRQGAEGWAYSFFTRNLAPLAAGLVALLERCKQQVDPNLRTLADEHRVNANSGSANGDAHDGGRLDGTEDDDEDAGDDLSDVGAAVEDTPNDQHDEEDDSAEEASETSSVPVGEGIGRGGGLRIALPKKRKLHNESASSSEAEEPVGGRVETVAGANAKSNTREKATATSKKKTNKRRQSSSVAPAGQTRKKKKPKKP